MERDNRSKTNSNLPIPARPFSFFFHLPIFLCNNYFQITTYTFIKGTNFDAKYPNLRKIMREVWNESQIFALL